MVTVYVPADVDVAVVTVRVAVGLVPGVRLTLVGTIVVKPIPVGDTAADSATFPVNPRLFAVIVDVPELPATNVRVIGLAEIVKSAFTVKVTVAVCVNAPVVPVTVTV